MSERTIDKQIKRLDRQTDQRADKQAKLNVHGLTSWNKREFANENQQYYAIGGGANVSANKGAFQILPRQEDPFSLDQRFGRVPLPSIEEIFANKQTRGQTSLYFDPETPNRSSQPGYNQLDSIWAEVPDAFAGHDDAGYEIGKKIKYIKGSSFLYPEHLRTDEGGYGGGSGLVNYPQYSVQEEPLTKGYPVRYVGTSDDSVQKLQIQQNLYASKFYKGIADRKKAEKAAESAFLDRKLGKVL